MERLHNSGNVLARGAVGLTILYSLLSIASYDKETARNFIIKYYDSSIFKLIPLCTEGKGKYDVNLNQVKLLESQTQDKEGNNSHTILHMKGGEKRTVCRKIGRTYNDFFYPLIFLRAHKSYLVNTKYIVRFLKPTEAQRLFPESDMRYGALELEGKIYIPLSAQGRIYYEVFEMFEDFLDLNYEIRNSSSNTKYKSEAYLHKLYPHPELRFTAIKS